MSATANTISRYFTTEATLDELRALRNFTNNSHEVLALFQPPQNPQYEQQQRDGETIQVEVDRGHSAGTLYTLRRSLNDQALESQLTILAADPEVINALEIKERRHEAAGITQELTEQMAKLNSRIRACLEAAYASDSEIRSLNNQKNPDGPPVDEQGQTLASTLSPEETEQNTDLNNQIETRQRAIKASLATDPNSDYFKLTARKNLTTALKTSVETWVKTGEPGPLPNTNDLEIRKNIGSGFHAIIAFIRNFFNRSSKTSQLEEKTVKFLTPTPPSRQQVNQPAEEAARITM